MVLTGLDFGRGRRGTAHGEDTMPKERLNCWNWKLLLTTSRLESGDLRSTQKAGFPEANRDHQGTPGTGPSAHQGSNSTYTPGLYIEIAPAAPVP